MSFENAKKCLEEKGFGDRIKEFSVSSATVALAAEAVGCESSHIAKTMSFKVGDGAVLVVAAGDTKIDNQKFKAVFHTKAKMLAADEVGSLIGHEVGGVCPFGINGGVKVCLDESLKRFDFVYPACGSSNSAVKLTCEELESAADNAVWTDVCKIAE